MLVEPHYLWFLLVVIFLLNPVALELMLNYVAYVSKMLNTYIIDNLKLAYLFSCFHFNFASTPREIKQSRFVLDNSLDTHWVYWWKECNSIVSESNTIFSKSKKWILKPASCSGEVLWVTFNFHWHTHMSDHLPVYW